MVPDLLADAASPEMQRIWSPLANVHLERWWWTNIMTTQKELGLDQIEDWHIKAAEVCLFRGVDSTTLERIDAQERITRHDVKARLDVWCQDVCHEKSHLGLTSADVVENTMQIKVRRSMQLLIDRHGMSSDELTAFLERYVLRGIKGAVGTQQDQLDLLGSPEACAELDRRLALRVGFPEVAFSVPQVMHRSQDLDVLSALSVACSWMDRRNPLNAVLRGFMAMAAGYAGDTWNEGDVSTSVVRRVAIPGAFYAADLICRRERL